MKNENGDILEVHPYAARFPLMNDEELEDLAEDIKTNGLKNPLIRDTDGTLIDGRNRLAACKIAKIQPQFIELNGEQDPIAFIISVNLKRRNLKIGQQAMLAALGVRKIRTSQKQLSKETGIDRSRIWRAFFVIDNAPDQIELVLTGLSLEEAYAEAQKRKCNAESEQAKTERLNKFASDLADQVSEGKLTLAEAIGALEVREKEKAIAEKDAQDQRVERANNLHMILGTLAIGPTLSDHKAKLALDIDWPTFAFMNKGITKKDWLKAGKTLSEIAKLWDDDYAKH